MRLPKNVVTIPSLLLVLVTGAAAGFGWARTDSHARPLPGVRFETAIEVRANDAGPATHDDAAVQDVVLQARLASKASGFMTRGGSYDLLVEGEDGESTLLSLVSAGDESVEGGAAGRLVQLGGEPPFDRPGRYTVRGTWTGDGGAPVALLPVEVVVSAPPLVALVPSARTDA
jgi:hypothetical protein